MVVDTEALVQAWVKWPLVKTLVVVANNKYNYNK